jgi:hypothetical protein
VASLIDISAGLPNIARGKDVLIIARSNIAPFEPIYSVTAAAVARQPITTRKLNGDSIIAGEIDIFCSIVQ